MNKIALAAALSFYFSSALAFQFQEFRWGNSLDQVMVMLKRKNTQTTASEKGKVVSYSEEVFSDPAEVALFFTPKNEVLFMVKISWQGVAAGPKIKGELIKLYGEPLKEDGPVERYLWFGQSQEDVLALDYSSTAAELFYSAGESGGEEEK